MTELEKKYEELVESLYSKLCEYTGRWDYSNWFKEIAALKQGEPKVSPEEFLLKQGYTKTVTCPNKKIVEPSFGRATVVRLLQEYAMFQQIRKEVTNEKILKALWLSIDEKRCLIASKIGNVDGTFSSIYNEMISFSANVLTDIQDEINRIIEHNLKSTHCK